MKKQNDEKLAMEKTEVGERCKQFRKFLEKPGKEFAKELGISEYTIYWIESGKVFPKIKYLYYWSKVYKLNLDWLFTGNGDMLLTGNSTQQDPDLDRFLEKIEKDPELSMFYKMFTLMKIPAVEQIIMGKLLELKLLFQEELIELTKKEDS